MTKTNQCFSIFFNNTLKYYDSQALTLKRLEGRGGGGHFDLLCGFSRNLCFREGVKPWYFVTFNFLSWKFYWNSSSRSEVMKNYSVNISFFHQFSAIFWIFWHFLITKKLMTSSAYNSWCQHFFTVNIL